MNMIGSQLGRISPRAVGNVGKIQKAFEKSRQGGGKALQLPEMQELFVKTISSCQRVYICDEAMDELALQDQSELLRTLRQMIQTPNKRYFLTGRPHIRAELDKNLTKGAYTIHIVPDQGDIGRYLSPKIEEAYDRDPGLITDNLKNHIMKTMQEKASEM